MDMYLELDHISLYNLAPWFQHSGKKDELNIKLHESTIHLYSGYTEGCMHVDGDVSEY